MIVILWAYVFISLGKYLWVESCIIGLYKKLPNSFPEWVYDFQSYQQQMEVPFLPYPLHHLVLLVFLIFNISSETETVSHCGFICISLNYLMLRNFCVFIDHFCIFHYEVSLQLFLPIFSSYFFRSSFYSLQVPCQINVFWTFFPSLYLVCLFP